VGEAQSIDTHKQGADVRDYGFDIGENFHNSQPLSLFCTLIIAYLSVNINNKLVIFRLQNFNLPGRRKRGRDCSRPSWLTNGILCHYLQSIPLLCGE
jgi:hypothetical protein